MGQFPSIRLEKGQNLDGFEAEKGKPRQRTITGMSEKRLFHIPNDASRFGFRFRRFRGRAVENLQSRATSDLDVKPTNHEEIGGDTKPGKNSGQPGRTFHSTSTKTAWLIGCGARALLLNSLWHFCRRD